MVKKQGNNLGTMQQVGGYMSFLNVKLANSKFFMGLLMLLMNIASRYVTVKLSKNQEQLIRNTIGRQFLVFAMAWMATKDLILSLGLTAIFVVLVQYLFNEESRFYVLNKELKSAIDADGDDEISEEELRNAINVLDKAKNKVNKPTKNQIQVNKMDNKVNS
jgi:hypothetical protein